MLLFLSLLGFGDSPSNIPHKIHCKPTKRIQNTYTSIACLAINVSPVVFFCKLILMKKKKNLLSVAEHF